MIFRGNLSELEEKDLQRLVDDQVQERDTLEYKSIMYSYADDDKREMLKDISSMANHRGGHLIIGIQADDEGIPIPTGLKGVELGNYVERIRNSCLDNIDKRIVGLEIEDIQLSGDKVAVIVSVPESINAPHMVTFKGLNQFWKRHGRQKDKMTVDEIGEAFEKRLSNMNRLDRFLFLRKAEILETIGDKTYMVISTSPAYLREEAVFDVQDKGLHDMISAFQPVNRGKPYPTLMGLRADNTVPYLENTPSKPRNYLEIFRNGYTEYGHLFEHEQDGLCFLNAVDAQRIVDFVSFMEKVYGTYLPLTPLVLNFAIYNAKGMWLRVSQYSWSEDKLVQWQRQHLELEKLYIENLATEAKLLAKRICDLIWQAFHRERANVFDEAGNLLGG